MTLGSGSDSFQGKEETPIRIATPALPALVFGLVLIAAEASPAEAQARQDSVLLQGRVVEEDSGEPIAFVDLTILDRLGRIIGRTESNEQGAFVHSVRDKSGVSIRVQRIGYQDNETPFLWFDGYDYYNLEVRMDPQAVLLAPLEVTARQRARSSMLANFDHRTELGMGWYLTREEIAARNASRVTDLLAEAPGVRLRSSGSGFRRTLWMARGGARAMGCPVQVYLDGMHLNVSGAGVVAIDEYVAPGSVEGIEVYRGLSTVPAEFLNNNAECGVVAVWTRRGGE